MKKFWPVIDNKIIIEWKRFCTLNSYLIISFYDGKKYDVSGTIVGIADKKQMLPNRNTESGNILVGLFSNGLHTNGYSLARKVLLSKYEIGIVS